ncbi:efflux RND transporter periplasmic adaptor subunit [Pirellulaceae bacterium SH467]|jgi:multidrug resistance efflux pump
MIFLHRRLLPKAIWLVPLIAMIPLLGFRDGALAQQTLRLADRAAAIPTTDPKGSGNLPNAVSEGTWIRFEQGIVVAPELVEIAVQETGTLLELKVSENSLVSKGEILGRLNSDTLELEKQVSALQFQVAQAEAVDESDIRFAEMVVEETQLQLDAYEKMGNKGEASPIEVRQKKIAAEQAKVRLVQAKAAKVQKDLKAKLAQASYSVSQKKLEKLQIASPVTGIVTRMDHRQGEWVSAGTTILHVIRMDELRVDFFVDLDRFDPNDLIGSPVEIGVAAAATRASNRFIGVITGYAPEVSSARKIRMSATVQNQKTDKAWTLLPGMNVSLQTHLAKK